MKVPSWLKVPSIKLPKIPYWPLLIGPYLSFGLGFAMNALVMALNHSQMPVQMPPGLTIPDGDWIHTVMTSATHLKILCDWIVIRGVGIASPGDFLEWAWEYSAMPAFWSWIALIVKDANR